MVPPEYVQDGIVVMAINPEEVKTFLNEKAEVLTKERRTLYTTVEGLRARERDIDRELTELRIAEGVFRKLAAEEKAKNADQSKST